VIPRPRRLHGRHWNKQWYGVKRFFEYLESKAYKMHIRVLLSKYRSYTPCETCSGARLKTESLLWRIGSKDDADAVLEPSARFMPAGVDWTRAQLQALPGLTLHDLMLMPITRLRQFFERVEPEAEALAAAANCRRMKLLFEEIHTRLKYLVDVGIGYLTLDRQSRTLSGGEVQRINLTTALGTSLVNTLFVLDEPSIGLHPARHEPHHAGHAPAARRRQHAGGGGARPGRDDGGRPHHRHGRRPGRARRPDRVRRHHLRKLREADTLTGAYLGARKHVGMGFKRAVTEATPRLVLEGAREHNLVNLSVDFPAAAAGVRDRRARARQVELIQDVLAPALLRHFGRATEIARPHDRMLGADH
jgi:excinuclease ABC subunit A